MTDIFINDGTWMKVMSQDGKDVYQKGRRQIIMVESATGEILEPEQDGGGVKERYRRMVELLTKGK